VSTHSDERTLKTDASTPDPVQQQLVAARRRQILDAATRVFSEHGFPRATIKEIARTAGVAEGTIYNYFGNKEDLLFGLLDRLNESDQRPEALGELAQGDLRATFEGLVRHRLGVAGDALPLLRALLPELLFNERLRRRWFLEVVAPTTGLAEAVFDRLVAAGELREVRTDLVVRLVAGMVFGTLLLELLGDPVLAAGRDALPAEIVALLFDGMAPGSGAGGVG
jgi:AcrR family transcriptional regulator